MRGGQTLALLALCRRQIHRIVATVIVLAVVAVMVLVFNHDQELYHRIVGYWSDRPRDIPFTDLHAILVQLQCARTGVDLLGAGQMPVACGTYNYSPLLLSLSPFALDPGRSPLFGIILNCVFACSLAALPVRKSGHDMLCMTLAVLSGMTFWAVVTANLDLLIFEVAMLISALAVRSGIGRFGTYILAIAMGGVKYYPIVLMVHALRERRGLFMGLLSAGVLATGVFVIMRRSELAVSIQQLPTGTPLKVWWGSIILPKGLLGLAGRSTESPAVPAMLVVLSLLAFLAALRQSRSAMLRERFSALTPWSRSLFVSGASLIVACFFAWQNLPYRGVFFLLVLPAALTLRDAAPGKAGPFRFLPAMILFLMWQVPLSHAVLLGMLELAFSRFAVVVVQLLIWAVMQAIWWWVITVLAALLLVYMRESEVFRWTRTALTPGRTR